MVNHETSNPLNVKGSIWEKRVTRRQALKLSAGALTGLALTLAGCGNHPDSEGGPDDPITNFLKDLLNKNGRDVLYRYSKVTFIREPEGGPSLKIRSAPTIPVADGLNEGFIEWENVKAVQANQESEPISVEGVNEFELENVEFVAGFNVDTGEYKNGEWTQIIITKKDGKTVYGYISKSEFTRKNVKLDPDGQRIEPKK